jgi:hypothetical protein
MAGEVNLSTQITNVYSHLVSNLPSWAQNFVNIVLLVVLVTLFCMFIWKIYTIISKKNIINLNLKQYNQSTHPVFGRFLGALLYFVEYIIIFPFFVFLWFLAFTFFLMLLTKGLEVQTILMVSSIIIISIRATAYYKEPLSRELAKLLPFTLLAVAMTEKGFFNFEEIIGRFSQLPLYFNNILSYLFIIVILEIVLRMFDFIFSLFDLEDEVVEEDIEDKEEETPVPTKK